MQKALSKINAIHKAHHVYLIALVSPVLMWLMSGIFAPFPSARSAGQLGAAVGTFLGQSVITIFLGFVVLVFARPSTAWITVFFSTLFLTYLIYGSAAGG